MCVYKFLYLIFIFNFYVKLNIINIINIIIIIIIIINIINIIIIIIMLHSFQLDYFYLMLPLLVLVKLLLVEMVQQLKIDQNQHP